MQYYTITLLQYYTITILQYYTIIPSDSPDGFTDGSRNAFRVQETSRRLDAKHSSSTGMRMRRKKKWNCTEHHRGNLGLVFTKTTVNYDTSAYTVHDTLGGPEENRATPAPTP